MIKNEMNLEQVLDFIKRHKLAVVSTSSKDGKPQSAVVEFGELDDLSIIIDTLTTSRKFKNLQANLKAAIVIGWDNDITVQIDADAVLLEGKELEIAKSAYFAKNARAKKWENRPDIVYFAFKPTWIRYSDVGHDPWLIKEF
jgi:general stress protein 26